MALETVRRRATRQLACVLDAVQASGTAHPTAEQVFARVRDQLPSISLGTVYRNLRRLATEGRIGIVHLADRVTRFDPTPGRHDHFVCDDCGRIEDVPFEVAAVDTRVAEEAGHRVTGRAVVLYGRCRACGAGS
jgi:Fur family peroxide stress response transcriptional regulator